MRSATSPAGTHTFTPSRRQRAPSRRAVVAGWAGSPPSSTRAAVSTGCPVATAGSSRSCCARVPNSTIGSAPITSDGSAGTGATLRPTCSSSRQSSRNPSPLPPTASGRAIPSRLAVASCAHVSRSNPSPPASTSFSRSWVTCPSSTCRAASRTASCSSVNPKSMTGPLSLRHRHAKAEDTDEVTLDLVGAATEGEDQQAAVEPLEPGLEHRLGRALLQVADLPDDLEHQPERLEVELGAENLGRRRVGDVEPALRGRPRHLPVDELEELELGVDPRQVELDPLLVDHPPSVGELGLLRPLAHLGQRALDDPRRAQRDALVVELVRNEAPAVVLSADEVCRGHPHVLVEGLVDIVLAEQAHRHHADAGRAHRHDEHRDALVLLRLGVGAGGQPHV